MEQHAIPQNVSSYQFKLVGDMTLKQFFQLAGGVILGIILWSTPLLVIIKGPLAIFSILLGIGLAFLPFEERPLERWIFAFFRAIYSPTVFTWQKDTFSAGIFQAEAVPLQTVSTPQDIALKDYLAQTTPVVNAPTALDKAEGNFFARLKSIATGTPVQKVQPVAQTPVTSPIQTIQPVIEPQPTVLTPASAIKSEPSVIQGTDTVINQTYVPQTSPVGNELKIPSTTPVSVQPSKTPVVVDEAALNPTGLGAAVSTSVQPVIMGNEMISTRQAVFSPEASPPNPPTYPNVVVGQVIDQDRRIIEGVIMEIRDSAGRPIRALRSNKAGHFITVTQLDNGKYEIITEKEGFEFTPVSFEATGTIIPPILVQGKRLSPLIEMPAVPVKPIYSIN